MLFKLSNLLNNGTIFLILYVIDDKYDTIPSFTRMLSILSNMVEKR